MQISEVIDFTKLSEDDQYKVIETAMQHEKLKWNDVLAAIYPQFKDTAFVSNLIQQYKEGLVKQPLTTLYWSSSDKLIKVDYLRNLHDDCMLFSMGTN